MADVRDYEVTPKVTQKAKEKKKKNHLNTWMLLHAEHFLSLSAACGASRTAEDRKCVRADAHLSNQPSLNDPHQDPLY